MAYFFKLIVIKKKYFMQTNLQTATLIKKSCVIVIIFLLFAYSDLYSQTFPANFSQVQVANGILNPTVMEFSPDGRLFVAKQTGELLIIKNGSLLGQPFISLNVNSSGERGLLGIAFDPNFNSNQFIYLYYTVSGGTHNRISRFTANGDQVVGGSEVVVLDLDPVSATIHNGGTMQFGPDGKLYIGVGENSVPQNAQNLNTYHGKILRINPDGSVPAGNPYTTGNNQRRRVWSYGLRNPYTLTFSPVTGSLFVNDVGQNAWEEINDATTGGLNFGWPGAEGNSTNPAYTNPVYAYQHGGGSGQGCAITGGTFFSPASTSYPAQYNGRYFYIDYCSGWIDMLQFSGSNVTRSNFATGIAGFPVCLLTGPDGNLYFTSRTNNAVYKVVYNGGTSPVITSQPQSLTVAQGNSATFQVSASGSAPLSYQWKKNGNDISGAVSSSYTISSVTQQDAATYTVSVSNASGSVLSNGAILTVTSANQAPVANIISPASGTTYAGGSIISYSGNAADQEDGSIGAANFTWFVNFHHDTHTHPGPSAADGVSSGSFMIPSTGETSANVFYRLYLVVHDSQGATDTGFVDIQPRTSVITIQTNPAGLGILLDGQPFTSPHVFTGVEGINRTINVISPQTVGNISYAFSSWAHGGSKSQTITTPASNTTYTATFTSALRLADNPVNTTPGVHYTYYQGTWTMMPDFNALTPLTSGNTLNFDLTPRLQNDDFAFHFTGYVEVPSDGIYTFYTSSDDGSNLYIGSTQVVNNDGMHATQEKSGQIGLKAGKHAITVDFFERGSQEVLLVSYAGPGLSKQPIPDAALYRSTGTQTQVLTPVADAYVRDGIYQNTNYGSALTLIAKKNQTTDLRRVIYMRFDISSLNANISSVKLRIYGSLNNSVDPSESIVLNHVSDNSWSEGTITWRNRPPAIEAPLVKKKITGTVKKYYEIDITQHIINQFNSGQNEVSLKLFSSRMSTSWIEFNSKEASVNRPQLVVTYGTALKNSSTQPNENHVGTTLDERISIYPNPTDGMVNINYDFNEEIHSSIYNSAMIQVSAPKLISGQKMDLSGFDKGIYFIRFVSVTGECWKKVILIK